MSDKQDKDKIPKEKSDLVFNESMFYHMNKPNHEEDDLFKSFSITPEECKVVWDVIRKKLMAQAKKDKKNLRSSTIIEEIWNYNAPLTVRIIVLFTVAKAKGFHEGMEQSMEKTGHGGIIIDELYGANPFGRTAGKSGKIPPQVKRMLKEILEESEDDDVE